MVNTDPQATSLLTRQFLLHWAGAFTVFFSFYLLLPTLPLYARGLGIAESAIGLIVGCFALVSMVMRPWAGWASDRYGRVPLLAAGALVFGSAAILYGFGRSVATLLLVRSFHGTGMAFYQTSAAALVADMTPPMRRGEAMGAFGTASNLALAVGPVLGVWVAERFGFPALFFASAGAAATALALTLSLEETLPRRADAPFTLAAPLSRPAIFPSTILLCLMATYGMQMVFLPLYVRSQGGGNPGIFFVVFALVIAGVRRHAGQLSDRVGRAPMATAGMLIVGLALGTLSLGPGLWTLILAGVLYGIGFGAAEPALMAWTIDRASPEERGKAIGTFYIALELGIGGGAIGFGLLPGRLGYPLTFVAAGVLALAGAILAGSRFRR
jgi:MFS family permease